MTISWKYVCDARIWKLPSLALGMNGDVYCATGRAQQFAHLAVKVLDG
jgi:hypothetical protein